MLNITESIRLLQSYANYANLPNLPRIDVRKYGAVGDGVTNDTAAIQAALTAAGASSRGGTVYIPPGTYKCTGVITWPARSNVHLIGEGRELSTLDFATSTTGGISYTTSSTKIQHCSIRELTIHGGGASSGTGVMWQDVDRSWIEDCRIYVWDKCLNIDSSGSRGAIHNKIRNCIVTNGTTYGVYLSGAQGPHQCSIYDGEISINGTGLKIDSPTDQTRVFGTSLESNTLAIDTNGCRSEFNVRFEGNTNDCSFGSSAFYNILRTAFFTASKHSDSATGAGIGTNKVVAWGFATSATELLPMIFVPADPMALALTSQVPGTKLAVSHKFYVGDVRKISTITIVPSVTGGNVDVAICDAGGTVLASSGSTATGTINVKQDIALSAPVFLGPNRHYYVVVCFDGATDGMYGVTSTSAGFNLGQNEVLARQKTLATFPIAAQNPISGASGTTICPAFRLA